MISKKELLDKMNISYGQLYRWKREGLIPDEWFNKQAVSTGQETFFDEKLIIPRIEKILEMKNDNQLKEMKSYFDVDITKREFSLREIVLVEELDPIIIKTYSKKKNILNIYDCILIYIMSKANIELYDYYDLDFNLNCKFYLYEDLSYVMGEGIVLSEKFKNYKIVYEFEKIAQEIAKELK